MSERMTDYELFHAKAQQLAAEIVQIALTAYRTSDGGGQERKPVEMLVDADWLRRRVEADPDGLDTEASSPRQPNSDGGDGEVEDLQRKLGGVGREAVKWEAKYYEALALLSRLEWSASTGWTGLACCPLCSQKMDDGHLPDCPFTGSDASSRGDMIHDDESLRVLVRTLCNDAGSVAEWARRSGLVDEQVGLFLRGARPAEPRILAALGMMKRVTYSADHGHSGDCGFALLKGAGQ